MTEKSADRIEELTAERDEALNQLDSARHSVDVLERRLTYKLTKLAKAVEALEEIMGDGDAMGCNPQLKADIASATLAELKGKSDE